MRPLILCCSLMIALAAALEAQEAVAPAPLAEIIFSGLKHLPASDAVKLAKLTVGQPVSAADLNAAMQQLGDSGLFDDVRYRYTTGPKGVFVTFQVVEAEWRVPIAFDNFVWFTDDELAQALRARIPTFQGRVDSAGRANRLVAEHLEAILLIKHVRARVEARPRIDLTTGDKSFDFVVRDPGVDMHVCALQLPGAAAIPASELTAAVDLIGAEYSRQLIRGVAGGTLTRLYRQRGHWAAAFAEPEATLGFGCSGVTVTLPVTEGVPYQWGGAQWTGVTKRTEAELNTALGMKPGALADVARIEDGLRAVHGLFENVGHLQETHKYTPQLDEPGRRATFTIAVNEGPQFRMGRFAVEAGTDSEVAELTRRWPLNLNDVFDASRLRSYQDDQRRRLASSGRRLDLRVELDATTGQAHVIVRLPAAAPAAARP